MAKKVRGKIASILAVILLSMAILPGNVAAADVTSDGSTDVAAPGVENGNTDGTGVDMSDSTSSDKEVLSEENQIDEEQTEEVQTEENGNLEDAAVVSQGLINYVGVEFPHLQTPQEQKLVVSFGDGTEELSDVKLTCEKLDGSILNLNLSEKENGLYLFRQAFSDKDTGTYRLVRFSYTQNGVNTDIELADIGIEAMFGVNEYYPGYEGENDAKAAISAEDVEISVVEVDADKVKNAEADVEEAIEETVEAIEADAEVAKNTEKGFLETTKAFFGSVANVLMPASTAKAAENVVVVLDPGHGGTDGGASAWGLVEKDLNLKIAQYCKAELEQYNGVDVYMTRESDVYVGLTERVQMAKNWGADVFVSIHINSAGSGDAKGVEVYYPNSSYNSAAHTEGRDLSQDILKELVALGLSDRGIKIRNSENNSKYDDGSIADYYSVIRDSKEAGFPGIIVEHAFITNWDDAARLNIDVFQRQLGKADATGIANYFNLTKGGSVKIENKNDFSGTAQIKINGVGSNGKVKVWNDTNPNNKKEYQVKDGKTTINFNINEFGGVRGQYYAEAFNSSGRSLSKVSFYIVKDVTATVAAGAADKKETQYNLSATFKEMPQEVKGVLFATWSEQGGQDDLVWYQGKSGSKGVWTTTADIKKHNTAGKYNVHAYASLSNGSMQFIGSATFSVSTPTLKISVSDYRENDGAFDVVLSDVQSPLGVKKIEVPVWSTSNQSDIRWYEAKRQADGTYKVTVNLSNHNYSTGPYRIHTYLTMENGVRVCTGYAPEKTVTLPKTVVSARDTNGKESLYELKVANMNSLKDVKGVLFATWSVQGGQDDLVWYQGSKGSNNVWVATADVKKHKTSGKYNVHAYATLSNGNLKYLGSTTFVVSAPALKTTVSEHKESEGAFDVVLSDIQSALKVTKVEVPVWSTSNQSDIRWYEAKQQSDGTYKVTVNIANHNYSTGPYRIHVYATTENGARTCVGIAPEKMVTLPKMEISAVDANGSQTLYTLKASNVNAFGAVRDVVFATWGERASQKDIVWYQGSKGTNGTWVATADIRKHKTAGNYNVHVYATLSNGNMKFLGSTTFSVSKASVSDVQIQGYDELSGCFRVVVVNPQAASGVDFVEVPVWCAANQSDIKWYRAQKQSDGNYYVDVNPVNHNNNRGMYNVHVYVTAKNGVRSFTESRSQSVLGGYTIMGATTTTVDQMVRYYKSSGNTYPSLALGVGGASTIEKFCELYFEEAAAEGVRAEVAFTQAMKETGWLQYGGDVKIEQFNFAGLGAVDGSGGKQSNSFADVRTGIRAQIQHLKAYGSTEKLNNPCVDQRFNLVARGSAKFVKDLSGKWASDPNYGNAIIRMIEDLKKK